MSGCNKGGCLCGAVRYKLKDVPTEYGACHCEMCRKWTGGIELGIQTGADGMTLDSEETLVRYKSSEWAERAFCGTCGSNMFWRLTAEGPMHGMLAVCAGTLDTLDGMTLTSEVYIDHKPAGHSFAQKTKTMTEADINAMVAASLEGDK